MSPQALVDGLEVLVDLLEGDGEAVVERAREALVDGGANLVELALVIAANLGQLFVHDVRVVRELVIHRLGIGCQLLGHRIGDAS